MGAVPSIKSLPRPHSKGVRRSSTALNRMFANVPTEIEVRVPDRGRVQGMPTCPIVLIMGE